MAVTPLREPHDGHPCWHRTPFLKSATQHCTSPWQMNTIPMLLATGMQGCLTSHVPCHLRLPYLTALLSPLTGTWCLQHFSPPAHTHHAHAHATPSVKLRLTEQHAVPVQFSRVVSIAGNSRPPQCCAAPARARAAHRGGPGTLPAQRTAQALSTHNVSMRSCCQAVWPHGAERECTLFPTNS